MGTQTGCPQAAPVPPAKGSEGAHLARGGGPVSRTQPPGTTSIVARRRCILAGRLALLIGAGLALAHRPGRGGKRPRTLTTPDRPPTEQAPPRTGCGARSGQSGIMPPVSNAGHPRSKPRRTGGTGLGRTCCRRWSYWSRTPMDAARVLDVGSADGPSVGLAAADGCQRAALDLDPRGLQPGDVCASLTDLPFPDGSSTSWPRSMWSSTVRRRR